MTFITKLLYFIDEVGEFVPQQKHAYRLLRKVYAPTYYKSLERLESRGLIERKQSARNKQVFMVTAKGRQILTKPTLRIKRTDGLGTIIAYDIPQSKRRERDTLRRYLIKQGYVLIQKSLFLSPDKPVNEVLE